MAMWFLGRMSKSFKTWHVDQIMLLPPSVQDLVPEGHLAHFVRDTVRDSLDLSAIVETYTEDRGFPPYDPTMMTALLLYAYCQGLYASRRIAKACEERVDFMAVTARQSPDFRTVSDFRKRHLTALGGLFTQVLKLCQAAGLVQLGHVALDGTKIKANASKHKAMSYGRMQKTEADLAATVQGWLLKAETLDAREDTEWGRERRGDELPTWVADKQARLEKIRHAKAALEADARASAEDTRTPPHESRGGSAHAWPTPHAPLRRPSRPSPAQFYGSREPDHEDHRWLRARVQRAGRRGCRQSDYRRPTGDQCAQRPAATRAPGRADQGKHRPTGVRGVGRCRLLLGSQSPGTESAAYPRLHRHGPATTRARLGQRKPSRESRDSHTSHAGETPTGRSSQSIPVAQTDGGARLRTDQTGARISADAVARTRPCGAGVEPGVSGPQLLEVGERSSLRGGSTERPCRNVVTSAGLPVTRTNSTR